MDAKDAKDAKDVLREARELISDPERWTQGAAARDASGSFVNHNSENAVAWCAVGAIWKVAGDANLATEAERQLAMGDELGLILRVNDREGYEAVLAMFDKALE